ncbi:hypothetical protein pEaSNUABM28_00022 [Erwinia phage pEa_SNUABM_28]|nr:hypothetical protein pEaSNUABM28_00022 [Erwinia phage pEa_SNUABM_28]WAK44442.1 hypothetical protein [Erwinia phage vB_Ea_2910A]
MSKRIQFLLSCSAFVSGLFLTLVIFALIVFNVVMDISKEVTTPLLIVLVVCFINNMSTVFLMRTNNSKS